jgi:predicted DNA-binding transcriptional regulator YafY
MAVADACRRHEQLRFDYTGANGDDAVRTVEPHHLVAFDRRWYLIAFDTDRRDWRTFRVDRLAPRVPAGPRFTPRRLPGDDDAATYLARRLSARAWRHQATVTVHEPAEAVAERLWPGMGALEAVDRQRCLLHLGADTPTDLAWMITSLAADFTLTCGPPELVDALRAQADRCLRALG